MNDAARAAKLFLSAARLNREDPLLAGSLLRFPDYGQLVITGDLHGHRRNFKKLMRFCDLKHFGARHVILHEIIHEEIDAADGPDRSHELLLQAARWKCAFPDQVHFLLSNHELAQVLGHVITKNGRIVTRDFEDSVRDAYGAGAGPVLSAMTEFMRSFALAGRTANRVFIAHSLPGPRDVGSFDPAVFARTPTDEDLRERGSAYALVWGRYHTDSVLGTLGGLLDADFFVCGHQPQEQGYDVYHDRLVILASEHNHGVFLPLDLKRPVTMKSLTRSIRPFAGVA